MAGAIALGFGIWLATKIGSTLPGKIVAGAVILAAFVVPAVATASHQRPSPARPLSSEFGMEPWSVEKVAQLRSENRVIFVDFTARWCVTCQVNKQVATALGQGPQGLRGQ